MIPAISPDQTRFCEICARPASEAHHVQHRSMGGTDHEHNLIALCRACHDHFHPEKVGGRGWRIETDAIDGVTVRKVFQGAELLWERHYPIAFDQGVFVKEIEATPAHLDAMAQQFRWLDNEGIIATGQALYELHLKGWVVRARLFQVALLRTPYGGKADKLRAIAREFQIGGRMAYLEAQAVEIYDAFKPLLKHVAQVPSADMLVLAAQQSDPKAAIELLVDRRAENPHYSRTTYRAELETGQEPEYHSITCTEPGCSAVVRHRIR